MKGMKDEAYFPNRVILCCTYYMTSVVDLQVLESIPFYGPLLDDATTLIRYKIARISTPLEPVLILKSIRH